MLAIALLSPPPLCLRDFCDETSKHVPALNGRMVSMIHVRSCSQARFEFGGPLRRNVIFECVWPDVQPKGQSPNLNTTLQQYMWLFTYMGRRRVDDNESFSIGQLGIGRLLIVCLSGTGAEVNGYDNSRLSGQLLRHIDVHSSAGRVVAKVLNLGELGRTTSERVTRHRIQKGKDGSNERREMHLEKMRK